MNQRLLTFELSKDGDELHIHGDAEGLGALIKALNNLKAQVQAGKQAHEHLMTGAWGGSELSAEQQASDSKLLHKVTVHGWPQAK